VCSMNRKPNSLLAVTYTCIATLTVHDSSKTWIMSNFHCCCFLRSLSSSSTGSGSYLTFAKSLFIKQCQQNILNYSETMVSKKLYFELYDVSYYWTQCLYT
jgi:cytochrome c-type biogenesis protein CcmH/NrfF